MSRFKRATRHQSRLRAALCGPPGGGKTFTALRWGCGFKGPETRVAVINTESGAIEKYEGLAPDEIPFVFDVLTLSDFSPQNYIDAIMDAGRDGYDVLIIDSLTHAWDGMGGALELADKKARTGGNSYTAWKDVTPLHRRMIEAIVRSPCHVIATMRTHVEYVLEENEKGKKVPRKIGMAPVQRKGMEYEFDIVADLDQEHILTVTKSRCPALDGARTIKPGLSFIRPAVEWVLEGTAIDPSHYAVTEADLERLDRKRQEEEAEARAAKAASQPPKTAEELAAEAAARRAAAQTSNGANHSQDAGAAAAQAAAPAGNGQANGTTHFPISHDQLNTIKDLCEKTGWPRDKQQAFLERRGVTKFKELDSKQAEECISGLTERYHKLNPPRQDNSPAFKPESKGEPVGAGAGGDAEEKPPF